MEQNLEKRLKRQVIGKIHQFEAIAPLGFENTLAKELKRFGIEAAVAGDGKVAFIAKITDAWKAVAYSRIANRVLMQISSFKAENFGQLEKHTEEIPWELYLNDSSNLNLHTTCKHSRLYHSDAVEERVRHVIEKLLAAGNEDSYPQHLYIQFADDRCTIWLDLAGEELYKRGQDRFVAEAPLKETIAAAMILEAINLLPQNQPVSTIIDPMAGSGTFSLEAAYMAKGIIPGKCRDFALKHQPAFKEATWNFILGHANAPFVSSGAKFFTSDISERPVSIIKHNAEISPLEAGFLTPQLRDFFTLCGKEIISRQAMILLNPPYGKRLDVDAPRLYEKIGQKLNEFKGCAVAILAPKDACTENLLKSCQHLDPRQNSIARRIETSHGGISLNAFFTII